MWYQKCWMYFENKNVQLKKIVVLFICTLVYFFFIWEGYLIYPSFSDLLVCLVLNIEIFCTSLEVLNQLGNWHLLGWDNKNCDYHSLNMRPKPPSKFSLSQISVYKVFLGNGVWRPWGQRYNLHTRIMWIFYDHAFNRQTGCLELARRTLDRNATFVVRPHPRSSRGLT